jgi:hypothetical protein
MSLIARAALMDDRSVASKPGRLRVDHQRYAAHFPFWPVVFGSALLVSLLWTATRPKLWPVALLALGLNFFYWLRVRLHFRFGCVNPAKVVSLAPFTLAVMTDLTTGEHPYPAIKLLRHPLPRGVQYEVGARCATIATYTGKRDAEHWEDFMPVMVDCATSSRTASAEMVRAIPTEEWAEFDRALTGLPQPLKLGIYPLST